MTKKYDEMTNEEIEFMKEVFRKNYFSRERYLESVQEEIYKESVLEGKLEAKKEITKNLLKQKFSFEIIEKITGLTKDEILEIQKENNNRE